MFEKDNLFPLVKRPDFTMWIYEAGAMDEANQARNGLGYFPKEIIKPCDIIYVSDGGRVSQHYAAMNEVESRLYLVPMD